MATGGNGNEGRRNGRRSRSVGSEEHRTRVRSVYVLPVRHVIRTMKNSLRDVEFAETEEFNRSVTSVLRVRMRHLLDVQPLSCSNDIMRMYREKYPFDTDDDTVRQIIKRLQNKKEKAKRKLDAAMAVNYDSDDKSDDVLVIDEDMSFDDDSVLESFDDEDGDFEMDDDDEEDMAEADDNIPLDSCAEVHEELQEEAKQQVDQGEDVVQKEDEDGDVDGDKDGDNDVDNDDDKDGENDINNGTHNEDDNDGEMQDNIDYRNIPEISSGGVYEIIEDEGAHIIDDAPPEIPEDDDDDEEEDDEEDDEEEDDDSVEVQAIANIHMHNGIQPVFNGAQAELIAMLNNEILKIVEDEIDEISSDDDDEEVSEDLDEDEEDVPSEDDQDKKPDDQPGKKKDVNQEQTNNAEKSSA